jgi:hypothetical protein
MCNKGEKEKMGKWGKEELRNFFSSSPFSPPLLFYTFSIPK